MKTRTWLGNEKGAVLLTVVVGLFCFVGLIALALDSGYFFRHKRIMQTAADAGALAGANEIFRNHPLLITDAALDGTIRNGFTHGSASVVVTVHHPPASGYYVGDPAYVEVLINQDVPTFFMRLFGINSLNVPARAVAGVRIKSLNCVHILNTTAEKALTVTSQSTLQAPSCSIADNSNAYNAFNIESGSVLTAGSISVTGGTNITSGSSASPTPTTGVPAAYDPLAYLQFPSEGSVCDPNDDVPYIVSSATATITPASGGITFAGGTTGVFCGGIQIASGSTVTFASGNYILVNGGLQVQSTSTVTGSGVTFFNTGGEKYQPIRIESGSSATFSAPTEGDYANILFFQDPNAGKPGDIYENLIASNIHAEFTGVMYFPTQILKLATSNSTAQVNGAVIADRLIVDSNSTAVITGEFGSPEPIKRLSLVE